jgi:alpha-1,2-mannosyltransferase
MTSDVAAPAMTARPGRTPLIRLGGYLAFVLAALAVLAGIAVTIGHLRTDPLADVRAYYDAGARLNAGLPLYPPDADTTAADFYRYPPLLAIFFRPLALLPYEVVAPLWGLAMVGCFLLTVRRVGWNRRTWWALAFLCLPIGWALAIGQAQVLVTLLTALGWPWAVALATNIKLFPVLVGLYWLGRREFRAVGELVAVGLGLLLLQFVLEPAATIHYLTFPNLDQVGPVNNFSIYAVSPILWLVLLPVCGIAVVLLARKRWGWAAAVTFSVLATPRLITYQLMTLLAGLRAPRLADSTGDPLPAAPARDASGRVGWTAEGPSVPIPDP